MSLHVGGVTIQFERRTIRQAYQIKDFARTGHAFASLVKHPTDEVINHITSQQERPAKVGVGVAKSSSGRSLRSSSVEPAAYFPFSWPVDKPAFRKALVNFNKDTQRLAELLGPPSTRTTPPQPTVTTTPDPPPSDTSIETTVYGNEAMPPTQLDMQQLQQEINQAVQRAVAAALQNLHLPPGPPGPLGPPGQPGTPGESATSSSTER